MRNPFATPFGAVMHNEVLFNAKRVAPYALMILFSANAVLWWGKGPAVMRGWAVNSDFHIVWLYGLFSFMTLPLFIALLMGDPVARDFRLGIDPLILSKPISRAGYLLGKFFGNFLVLVGCQAWFALTLMLLQGFSTSGMIVLTPRVLPYFQHFFFFNVISSLTLAAVCFTVGTLTRNVKIVYGLAVCFYPLYIAWQLTMKGLPLHWRIALDPLLLNFGAELWKGRSADWLNQLTISYDAGMIANRVVMMAVALTCLAVVYVRFAMAARAQTNAGQPQTLLLDLRPRMERLVGVAETFDVSPVRQVGADVAGNQIAIPPVHRMTAGWRAGYKQFMAALGVEFRLLRSERSLVVVAPLMMFLCGVEVANVVVTDLSYAAMYASRTANVLLLFLFGLAVFYTGETMHRDRELRIEHLLWSIPAPNCVLLLSKFSATLLLSMALMTLVALTAIGIQIYKGHTPLELPTYLTTYAVILVPSTVLMIGASVALNVLLGNKYLAYVVSLVSGGATYYLASQGYHSWLYNLVLYQLWTPSDLMWASNGLTRLLTHRLYCLSLAVLCLAFAHLFFERHTATKFQLRREAGSILITIMSLTTAVITGLMMTGGV